jgi:hypothetical protein
MKDEKVLVVNVSGAEVDAEGRLVGEVRFEHEVKRISELDPAEREFVRDSVDQVQGWSTTQVIKVSETPIGEYRRDFLVALSRSQRLHDLLSRSVRVRLQERRRLLRGVARRAVFSLEDGAERVAGYR